MYYTLNPEKIKFEKSLFLAYDGAHCGHGLVVEHVLAKDEMGVRFSLAAPKISKRHSNQNDISVYSKRHLYRQNDIQNDIIQKDNVVLNWIKNLILWITLGETGITMSF